MRGMIERIMDQKTEAYKTRPEAMVQKAKANKTRLEGGLGTTCKALGFTSVSPAGGYPSRPTS